MYEFHLYIEDSNRADIRINVRCKKLMLKESVCKETTFAIIAS